MPFPNWPDFRPFPNQRHLTLFPNRRDITSFPKWQKLLPKPASPNTGGTRGYQQTTMTDSIQFSGDNRTVHSFDGQVLNKAVNPATAMSDTAKAAGINIQTRTGGLHTFNSGNGVSTVAPSTTSVQLQAPTGLVKVPGTSHEVTPEVLEKMRGTSPELFLEPEVKAAQKAEATNAAADAAAEEAKREEINRFVDDAAEGVAMHVNAEVSLSDRTQLLWQLHSTGTVSGPTMQRVAEQMHLSVDDAAEALNAVHTNHSFQVATLCGAKGVDAQGFASWAKTNRATETPKCSGRSPYRPMNATSCVRGSRSSMSSRRAADGNVLTSITRIPPKGT
jgi:hypothetical protein